MINSQFGIKWRLVLALGGGWLAATAASAQEGAGDGGLRAEIGLHFDLNDNLYDNNDQVSESWASRISPVLSLSSADGSGGFLAQYIGDYGKFFDSPDDNYADHSVTGRGRFERGRRGMLEVSAGFDKGHNPRGSGLTEGVPPDSPDFPTEPDVFGEFNWAAQYTHGRAGARGSLSFGIGERVLEYDTSRDRTQFFDRDEQFARAGLTIGVRERTSFVLEASYTNTSYELDRPEEPSRDGDNTSVLIGVTWEATSKTEGSVRVGMQRRSFDDPVRPAEKSATWDIAVRWLPREHSYFDFVADKANEETTAEGDFIDRSRYGVTWTHRWPIGVESVLRWNRLDQDFVRTNRKQDTSTIYFGLYIPQGDRVMWEASASRRDRKDLSTEGEYENIDFEGMLYTIGVNLLLIR